MTKRRVQSWTFVILFLLGAAFSITIFGKVTILTCNRTEPSKYCNLVESGLLGAQRKQQIPLNILKGARVREDSSIRHGSTYSTYQTIIITSKGEVPFTSYSTSDKTKAEAISLNINKFVEHPQITSLNEKQDDRLFTYLTAAISIIAAFTFLIRAISF